jgi:DNA-binding PucR family transcriptional regulator
MLASMPPTALAMGIVDAVRADRERVVAGMVAAITGDIGDYEAAPDVAAVLEDLREHCDAHVSAFLASAEHGTIPEGDDLEFVRTMIGRRVAQGIPLDAVLHAFRIGHQVVWEAIVAHAEAVPDGPRNAILLVRPSMQYVDAISTCVADAYLQEQQRAVADADRMRRDALELLLGGEAARGVETARGAGVAIDPGAAHLVLVAASDEAHAPTVAEDLGRAFGAAAPLVVARHGAVTALIAASEDDALARLAGVVRAHPGLRAGLGLAAALDGLEGAHRQAGTALALADVARPVVALGQIAALDYLVATADATARELVAPAVRRLAAGTTATDRALCDTLAAYVRSGLNVQRTAAALPAHPNTVHHRLRRIAERTGCDLRDVEDLLRLWTELRLAGAG